MRRTRVHSGPAERPNRRPWSFFRDETAVSDSERSAKNAAPPSRKIVFFAPRVPRSATVLNARAGDGSVADDRRVLCPGKTFFPSSPNFPNNFRVEIARKPWIAAHPTGSYRTTYRRARLAIFGYKLDSCIDTVEFSERFSVLCSVSERGATVESLQKTSSIRFFRSTVGFDTGTEFEKLIFPKALVIFRPVPGGIRVVRFGSVNDFFPHNTGFLYVPLNSTNSDGFSGGCNFQSRLSADLAFCQFYTPSRAPWCRTSAIESPRWNFWFWSGSLIVWKNIITNRYRIRTA